MLASPTAAIMYPEKICIFHFKSNLTFELLADYATARLQPTKDVGPQAIAFMHGWLLCIRIFGNNIYNRKQRLNQQNINTKRKLRFAKPFLVPSNIHAQAFFLVGFLTFFF
jgi:hypothetical protein